MTGEAPGASASRWRCWVHFWLLALVLASAALVRGHGLGSQPLWGDECYGGCMYLKAPDLAAHFDLVWSVGPENAPVYLSLQYVLARYLGLEPPALRFISFVAGLLSILLIYALGASAFNRTAALVAAALLAASPVHIWYSQALRCYALLLFWVLLALYALVRAYRKDGWGWWIVFVLANVAVVWTHYLYVVFLFAEWCLFAALMWRRKRVLLLVSLLQGLLLLPYLKMLAALKPLNLGDSQLFSAGELLAELVGTCCHGIQAPELEWMSRLPFGDALGSLYRLSHHALGALMLLGLLAFPFLNTVHCNRRERLGWVALAVVPALVMGGLTLLTGLPFQLPRYVLAGLLTRFLLVGALISVLGTRLRMVLVVAFLTPILVLQAVLFGTSKTRTDWRGAMEYVRERASPGDMMVMASVMDYRVLRCNDPDGLPPMASALNYRALCDAAVYYLAQPENAGASAWVLGSSGWAISRFCALENTLGEAGLAFRWKLFPAWEGIYVYQVARSGNRLLEGDEPCPLTHPARLLEDLVDAKGASLPPEFPEDLVALVSQRFQPNPDPFNSRYLLELELGSLLCAYGYEELLAWCEESLPELGASRELLRGMKELAEPMDAHGEPPYAWEVLNHNLSIGRLTWPFFRDWRAQPESLSAEVRQLEDMGFALDYLLSLLADYRNGKERPAMPFGVFVHDTSLRERFSEYASRESAITALPDKMGTALSVVYRLMNSGRPAAAAGGGPERL